MTSDLAILYEHPSWFTPLFRALERRGVPFQALELGGHSFDPEDRDVPAPLVLNRVSMSSFLRASEHGIFYAQSLLAGWEANGATVLNGASVMAVDASKARQLALFSRLGLAVPRTRVVHRRADLPAAAEAIGFPLLVKANIGGAGAGIARYDSADALTQSIQDGTVPGSIDNVLLVQDYVPARDGRIIRMETLAGRFLYAIEVETGGDSFDLCPADACVAAPGRTAIRMAAHQPSPELVRAAEQIAAAARLNVGGVEFLVDDRDGTPRFYDFNALSNFVANPLEVLGWDPHERLVDHLLGLIGSRAAA